MSGILSELTPTLLEYLRDEQYADGTPRERATLTVFVEGGLCKVCLNDRQEGATAWASAGSLEDVLSLLEDRLAKGSAEWRRSQPYAKRKAK